jgi:hypothetical protein
MHWNRIPNGLVIAGTDLIDFRKSHICFLFDRVTVVLERRQFCQFNTVEIRKCLFRPRPLQQPCAMHWNRIPNGLVIAGTDLIDFRKSHIYFLFDRVTVVLERRQFNTVEIRKCLFRPLPLQQPCAMHWIRIPSGLVIARTGFAILENLILDYLISYALLDFSGLLART